MLVESIPNRLVLASLANLTVETLASKAQPDLSITSATLEPDNITTSVAMAQSFSQAYLQVRLTAEVKTQHTLWQQSIADSD